MTLPLPQSATSHDFVTDPSRGGALRDISYRVRNTLRGNSKYTIDEGAVNPRHCKGASVAWAAIQGFAAESACRTSSEILPISAEKIAATALLRGAVTTRLGATNNFLPGVSDASFSRQHVRGDGDHAAHRQDEQRPARGVGSEGAH